MKRGQYPRFSFAGKTLQYQPNEATFYDPDSLFACFPVEGVMYEHSFRVLGIDAIENKIKKTDMQTIGIEQRAALLTRRDVAMVFAKQLVSTYPFTIYTQEQDKYGRILCRVVFQMPDARELDLASTLINRYLVFPYAGDKKMTLVEQADFCIKNQPRCDINEWIP